MPSEVVVLQHVDCETIGSIQDVLAAKQTAVRVVRLFKGEPVPRDLGAAGGLIVMGGPMGVYDHDRFPFLTDEMRLIEATARADKPVPGICLGSQLLAAALGATVKPSGRQEIGWREVTLAPAAKSDELLARTANDWRASFPALGRARDLRGRAASSIIRRCEESSECTDGTNFSGARCRGNNGIGKKGATHRTALPDRLNYV
jgi:putative intracellular protease/amidase